MEAQLTPFQPAPKSRPRGKRTVAKVITLPVSKKKASTKAPRWLNQLLKTLRERTRVHNRLHDEGSSGNNPFCIR